MGHVRVYTLGHALASIKEQRGLMYCIQWDGCGMPAENAAFENKIILPYGQKI